MSDETPATPIKKSRSTSDAERRRARRAQKILSAADSRLHRITATYSLSANASPVTSKKSSPQQSQKSSPTTSEAPDSPFSTRRNTGNLEPLPESLLPTTPPPELTESPPSTDISGSAPCIRISEHPPDQINGESTFMRESQESQESQDYHPPVTTTTTTTKVTPSPNPPTSSEPTFNTEVPSSSTLPGENNTIHPDEEYLRRILENFRTKNSSNTSLASTSTGEYQYYSSPGGFSPFLTPEDLAVQEELFRQQLEQQQRQQQDQSSNLLSPSSIFFNSSSSSPPLSSVNVQQINLQSKLWNLIHFSSMILLALSVILSEFLREKGFWTRLSYLKYSNPDYLIETEKVPSVSLFWYFITIELILQSTRLFLQKEKVFQGSVLGNLATRLPSPFSDILVVFLRYNLIWKCLLEDACVLVFIIGFSIMTSPIISYFVH
ncbi:hypothetical protein Glove_208g39 [Diversispora epigaea]|uniref:Uncharacterized protein n=1 Tax=Diversispora epigaea TaxID=1348612 RepID=A0A397ISW9_9GLOM|nr:hypothetical protein Glove_208g39 [Diversispora epigaea]